MRIAFVSCKVVVISASDVVETVAPGASVDCDPYCVIEVLPEGSRPKSGPAENTKYKTGCKVLPSEYVDVTSVAEFRYVSRIVQ